MPKMRPIPVPPAPRPSMWTFALETATCFVCGVGLIWLLTLWADFIYFVTH